jgi:hypothetical protein
MHARVTTIYGTEEQGVEAVSHLRDVTLPALKELDGWKGTILLVDSATGKASAISLWESQEALDASEEAAVGLRRAAADAAGATEPPVIDRYEVVIWEVAN